MKLFPTVQSLIAAACMAAPATGFSGDHDSNDNHGDHSRDGGRGGGNGRGDHGHDFHGRYGPSGYHGHYYSPGPRFFFGGGPFFWGPSVGFSFYSSPDYYASDDGPGPQYYRGAPVPQGNAQDDLGVDVQRALADHGYYRGALDGEIGPGSRAAIRAYQRDHGLEVTGRIDSPLLRSLRVE